MKRMISLLVVCMMFFTMLPANAAVEKADGGTNVLRTFNLKNGNAVYQDSKTGYYVARTAKYKFFESAYWAEQNELGKPNCYTTKDYIKFYDDGTLTEEEKEAFRIKYSTYEKNESGAWVKVQKTLPDEDTFTNEGWALDVPESAPEEFTFTKESADGTVYHYSVLDSEDGGYLIYCNDGYGSLTMNSVPKNNVFDPTPSEGNTNIATFLNGDFYNGTSETGSLSGNYSAYTALDTTIKNYIIEHTFIQAGNNQGAREDRDLTANSKTDYKVNCRIALISYADYIKYAGKIGYKSENTTRNGQILLRDCGNNSWNCVPLLNEANGNILGHTGAGQNVNSKNYTVYGETPVYFRPLFWVSKDYFKNVKLDSYGAEVKTVLKENCTKAELEALGYTAEQIADIKETFSTDVSVSNVGINGTLKPGYTLSAAYTLSDSCSDSLTGIKWLVKETQGSEAVVVSTDKSLKLTNDMAGKYISVEVTPKAEDVYGTAVAAEYGIIANALDSVTHLPIIKDNLEYKFTYGNKSFVAANDEEGGIYSYVGNGFRLSEGFITSENPAITPATALYDPADENNVAYWLNTSYITDKLGADIAPYLVEKEYLSEGGKASDGNDYVVKCKVALPAYWEMLAYSDKIGVQSETFFGKDTDLTMHIMRSATSSVNQMYYYRPSGKVYPITVRGTQTDGTAYIYNKDARIRPTMVIGYDFFKTHKLSYVGTGIARMIRNRISYEDMLAGGAYTEEELKDIFDYGTKYFVYAPTVEDGKTASLVFENASNEDISPVVIFSAYDENGVLYEAKAAYTDGAVASKGTYTFTAEFSEAHTNAVIKAYVFESLANIKPLVPLVTDFSASYTDSSEDASLSVAQSVNGADKYVAVLSVANAEAGETGVLEVKDGSGALIASNHA